MATSKNTIGKALREARLAKGITQAKLGSLMGYSAMAISHFENGTRPIRNDEIALASSILERDLTETKNHASTGMIFRASNLRGGGDHVTRSLDAFSRHIEKKYGSDSGSEGIN